MAHEKREDRLALLCDDCNEEIFVDVNMLMVHDKLWAEIISRPKELKKEDALCACCMEKRLGRKLTRDDWKPASGEYHLPHPMCNYMTEEFRNSPEGKAYELKLIDNG